MRHLGPSWEFEFYLEADGELPRDIKRERHMTDVYLVYAVWTWLEEIETRSGDGD